MVVERITSRSIATAVVLALALGACVKRQTLGSRQVTGTCEGACEHYASCKKGDDPALLRRCVRECKVIYADDAGVEDTETLGLFERLDCEEAIGFVEGEKSATGETSSASKRTDTDDN